MSKWHWTAHDLTDVYAEISLVSRLTHLLCLITCSTVGKVKFMYFYNYWRHIVFFWVNCWMNTVRMNVSPETKLNQQFTRGYKSCAGSTQLPDGSSPSDFTCDLNKNHGERKQTKCPTDLNLPWCQHCGYKSPDKNPREKMGRISETRGLFASLHSTTFPSCWQFQTLSLCCCHRLQPPPTGGPSQTACVW